MPDKDKPYNQLPTLPPKVDKIETDRVLKALIQAHKQLSALKGEARSLPNQRILFTTLPLQEAASSCEIENIVTTHDDLYKAISSDEKEINPSAKEIINYREAIHEGQDFLSKNQNLITTRLFESVCSALKGTNMTVRKTPDVKLQNAKKETVYTPPEGEVLVRDLLQDLENFLNNEDNKIDALTRMCIAHYQFEAIHPFSDGNGRTGRILNTLILIKAQLLDYPILYLSHYINKTKANYYKKLSAVTFKNEWEEWILYMLEAVEKSSYQTRKKIEEIKNLQDKQYQVIKNLNIANAKELTDLIITNPYSKIEHFVNQGLGERTTGSKHLHTLAEHGMLNAMKIGRNVFFINKDLWKLITNID